MTKDAAREELATGSAIDGACSPTIRRGSPVRASLTRAASILPIVLLSLFSVGSEAQTTLPRLRANPLRARRASELAQRRPTFAPPDGGATGNPDSGVVVEGEDFWWIGSSSPGNLSVPNSGIQAVIDAVNSPPSSGCFGCWTSAVLNNGYWGQLGFSACNLPGTPALFGTFYQVWDLEAQPQALLVDAEFGVATEGPHTYAMALQSGATWAFSVDGTIFGTYDMGSATSSGPGALDTICEEGNGVLVPYAPAEISIPIAMSLLNDGSWSGAPTALVYNSVGVSGVSGNLQDSSLPKNAISIGGSNPFDAQGTQLWSGTSPGFAPDAGPAGSMPLTLPSLSLTSPATNTTVSGLVTVSGSVENPPGASKISQMGLMIEDPNGGHPFKTELKESPFSVTWDTTQVPNGTFYIYFEVVDALGRSSYIDISVQVDNVPGGTGGTNGGGATATTTGGNSEGSGTSSGSAGGSTGMMAGSSSGGNPSSHSSGSGCSSAQGTACLLISSLLFLAWRRANDARRRGSRLPPDGA